MHNQGQLSGTLLGIASPRGRTGEHLDTLDPNDSSVVRSGSPPTQYYQAHSYTNT